MMTDHDFDEPRLRADLRQLVEPASATLQARVAAIPDEIPASLGRRLPGGWRLPPIQLFAPVALAAAAALIVTLLGIGLLARSPFFGPPSTLQPAASESAVPSTSLRALTVEDLAALAVQDGDLAGGSVSPGQAPVGEPSTQAWTKHLEDHGLQGRWWTYLDSLQESPLGYGYIGGVGVSLWADAEAAVDALAFENSTPRDGIGILSSLETPELGDQGWCGVLDFPPALNDRAWCRFAVSNATFDLWMRTGDQLDPRATGDLTDLGLRLRERAERVAAGAGS